jgi:hypothetical protein
VLTRTCVRSADRTVPGICSRTHSSPVLGRRGFSAANLRTWSSRLFMRWKKGGPTDHGGRAYSFPPLTPQCLLSDKAVTGQQLRRSKCLTSSHRGPSTLSASPGHTYPPPRAVSSPSGRAVRPRRKRDLRLLYVPELCRAKRSHHSDPEVASRLAAVTRCTWRVCHWPLMTNHK